MVCPVWSFVVVFLILAKAFNVQLRDVFIDNLSADEGRAMGLDLIGDEIGRASFFTATDPYISTDNVKVRIV